MIGNNPAIPLVHGTQIFGDNVRFAVLTENLGSNFGNKQRS